MKRSIYSRYKERLVEIGGNNRCIYLKNTGGKNCYDLGRLFENREDFTADFTDFLWSGKRGPFTLIDNGSRQQILKNIAPKDKADTATAEMPQTGDESGEAEKRAEKQKREDEDRAFAREISRLKEIRREIDEIEKDTGRYELFLAYPFVFGTISAGLSKTSVKAPLMLFPISLDFPDENTVEMYINDSEPVQLNRALLYAYAQAKKLVLDDMVLDYESLADSPFRNLRDVLDYIRKNGINIDFSNSRNILSIPRYRDPSARDGLSVKHACVIGRFPLANSIYNDYSVLEKKKLSNEAINELLNTGVGRLFPKRAPACRNSYPVKMLDYAQYEVVKKVDQMGNMVIYGPPGTGKSQTIVNIITDAICKNKKVLVVSQKKAALDVVYNRLGELNEKAMYIVDEGKERQSFYERCLIAHQKDMIESLIDIRDYERRYSEIQEKIDAELATLTSISDTLNTVTPFGMTLSDMYASSYMISKNSVDYSIYAHLVKDKTIMSMSYSELSDALAVIRGKDKAKLYYNYVENKKQNPLIDHLRDGLGIHIITEARARMEEIIKSRKGIFDIAEYPYCRQILAYYNETGNAGSITPLIRMAARFKEPGKYKFLGASKVFFPLYPLAKKKVSETEREVKEEFLRSRSAIEEYVKEYEFLHDIFTDEGYIMVIDNILRGNMSFEKLVLRALDDYISLRDVNNVLSELDSKQRAVLNFAYTISRNYLNYKDILGRIIPIRIYHEVIVSEDKYRDRLSKIVDFQNIRSRIIKLKEQQLVIANRICSGKNSKEYDVLYSKAKNNKDYLYQISKKQNFWPIRKTMEIYHEFVTSLFPCWLLSPENVSSILPLTKNLFDIVIFDEASQVFIESTLPAIYRGRNVVVAGDSKQLRPTATFMKRYLGGDAEDENDYSVQAALEVESLLDLAVARYDSANLTYHYRSRNRELIDFSNFAFYGGRLQISPNVSKNVNNKPIERIKVNGKWVDRKNLAEARKVVEILKKISETRKHGESIGIITFNADQQSTIEDMIDRECSLSPEFRSFILRERSRKENGEDISLFVKNLENVQGDERDIIIFSIGYAAGESGKIMLNFGPLSSEGGENRLNVAITRAKTKIYVVTSIEPEELKVDTTKNLGPKYLKKYLTYVRGVSDGNAAEVKSILSSFSSQDRRGAYVPELQPIEEQIKERLEKAGYSVDTGLGNMNCRISLAVYDADHDKFLVGVELDRDVFQSSDSVLERDVYRPMFFEGRGWNIIRVWCRDWWLSPAKVIKTITSAAEKKRGRK